MSDSPHLGLGYLAPAQAQKHVTVNEALRRLDALVQLGVLDRTRTAPPASPAEGDRHIVAAGATGVWAGKSGKIAARLDGAWAFVTPKPGWLAYVAAENLLVVHLAGAWTGALGALSSLDGLTRLGINATSDATNRLAVASQAVLFNHDGAGVQVKLNKQAASDTASLLFQTGFSGRAEFGLTGADGLALKVSPDGASWVSALAVNAASGAVEWPATPFVQLDKFTSSGLWTKPAWASRVRVMLFSAGAGGGSGGVRGPGVAVSGGGGGAPGIYSEAEFLASSLTATVSVTIGAGGAGGPSQTAADSAGSAGGGGGQTSFGGYLRAFLGSAGGAGGGTSTAAGGVAGGSRFLPPCGGIASGAGSFTAGGGGGAGHGRYASGAGGGGGLNAANAEASGGAASSAGLGTGYYGSTAAGAAPGGAGAAGAPSTLIGALLVGGNSGSGGASGAAVPGGAGGDGGAPGGGGGGGGASRNGQSSGKGGAGARGEAWIVSMR